MSKSLTLLLLLCGIVFGRTQAQPFGRRLVVAADGSSNYRTVQAALNAVPKQNTVPVTIFIKKGTYKEKITLPAGKNHVTLSGEDALATVLVYDDFQGRVVAGAAEPLSTADAASCRILADDFAAENLTFQNTAGPASPAPALWVHSDRAQFRNCRFLGLQGTLYTDGQANRHYYQRCFVEGTTDFVLGAATAWFEECTLFCKAGGSCLAAPATPDGVEYGFVFDRCHVVGDAPHGSYVLARAWEPFAKAVFLHCELAAVVKPEGWGHWGARDSKPEAFFAEFKSQGHGAQHHLRHHWSHQLSHEQAILYTPATALRGWTPNPPLE